MCQTETPNTHPKPQKNLRLPHQRTAAWLFLLSLAIYLLTRLIGLPNFPIYFFTDEAIQTQHAADLIQREFRSPDGTFLPTYFENGGQYNLSLSVYSQVLPTLLFGKSVWVTRGVSVFITLLAAVFLGLILKVTFKSRHYWLGPLLLAAVPAWFLHSRTAFETMIMASMFAGFLTFYLRYRQGKPKMLFISLIFGALAFYAYSPGQVIMVAVGIMLLIVDARYHWKHRKTAAIGLGILVLLFLPYLRFRLTEGEAITQHLSVLNAYWVKPIPWYEKLLTYFTNYLKGLNPVYWFWPNPSVIEKIWPDLSLPSWLFSYQHDLKRHTMKGYGHILLITLPFWIAGLVTCFKKITNPPHRTLLLATFAVPSGAAIVDWGITRGMAFIIPTTLITALGIEIAARWVHKKWKITCQRVSFTVIFSILTVFIFWMLTDSLINGPTWYDDYGLHGLQYGGQQIFSRAAEIAQEEPKTTILVSSTWANGPNVIMRFFTNDMPNVRMGNINAFGLTRLPLDQQTLFVMTENDLTYTLESGKFTNILIEETIPYPDGRDGFYFVRLDYVAEIDQILAAEQVERQRLLTGMVTIQDQSVKVQYPVLDMNKINHIFDGDPTSLIRTLEANPLVIKLSFSEPTAINKVTMVIGGTPTKLTATGLRDQKKLALITEEVGQSSVKREIALAFPQTLLVDQLYLEVLNTHDGEVAHVHLWEVTLE